MNIQKLNDELAVTARISSADIGAILAGGYKSLICCRPDGEAADQPAFNVLDAAARAEGLDTLYFPVQVDKISDDQVQEFGKALDEMPKPILAFCRTGKRATVLWALSRSSTRPVPEILAVATRSGHDLSSVVRRMTNGGLLPQSATETEYDIVIVGAGAAGISTAASILKRRAGLNIALIDPAEMHYYQPGWTLVGNGVFTPDSTARTMASRIPEGVKWIKSHVAAFEPDRNAVVLENARITKYKQLVVCPGLKLDWNAIEGLSDTLGRNGVTSNYKFELAPYTWEVVRKLRGGKAIFTQPPMPIKCAGAPQKAMYLSADHWRRTGALSDIDIDFCNAGAVLFGVATYVPALMEYIASYGINLQFGHTLVAVDGNTKTATFARSNSDGTKDKITTGFDMIHVVPPQVAPDFIRASPLADASGWVTIDPASMRHTKFANVYALGDVANSSNAKTAAAARMQAPVVAHNVLAGMGLAVGESHYNGYGSCPLTVERGKIVLAEFLYGGKVAPSFPSWLLDGTKPSRLAWLLKEKILPALYWQGMLKGRELLFRPDIVRD